jgi:hypothetical protein
VSFFCCRGVGVLRLVGSIAHHVVVSLVGAGTACLLQGPTAVALIAALGIGLAVPKVALGFVVVTLAGWAVDKVFHFFQWRHLRAPVRSMLGVRFGSRNFTAIRAFSHTVAQALDEGNQKKAEQLSKLLEDYMACGSGDPWHYAVSSKLLPAVRMALKKVGVRVNEYVQTTMKRTALRVAAMVRAASKLPAGGADFALRQMRGLLRLLELAAGAPQASIVAVYLDELHAQMATLERLLLQPAADRAVAGLERVGPSFFRPASTTFEFKPAVVPLDFKPAATGFKFKPAATSFAFKPAATSFAFKPAAPAFVFGRT